MRRALYRVYIRGKRRGMSYRAAELVQRRRYEAIAGGIVDRFRRGADRYTGQSERCMLIYF